jgi:hypothetical protein
VTVAPEHLSRSPPIGGRLRSQSRQGRLLPAVFGLSWSPKGEAARQRRQRLGATALSRVVASGCQAAVLNLTRFLARE